MLPKIIAQVAGVLASATIVGSFQVRSPRRILIIHIIAMSFFTLHFALLGTVSGTIQNALGVLRNLLMLLIPAKTRANRIAEGFVLAAFAAIPLIEYAIPSIPFSPWDLLPAAAMVVGTVLYWKASTRSLRIAQLFIISPCWLTYDVIFCSIPGMVTETFNMTSVIVSFIRMRRSADPKESEERAVERSR